MKEPSEASEEVPRKLWVDRYAPRTYTDLLSEEVNMSLFSQGKLLQCINVVSSGQA